jgi:hypothetical protein
MNEPSALALEPEMLQPMSVSARVPKGLGLTSSLLGYLVSPLEWEQCHVRLNNPDPSDSLSPRYSLE